jgi:hypothetical protein
MTFEFSTEMKTDFNMSLLDSSVMELSITPSNERLAAEDVNMSRLNFTWNVTSFEGRFMHIDLAF